MKPILTFDTECFINYFLIQFRNVETGKLTAFELYDGHLLDTETVRKIFVKCRVVGFNSSHYDLPLIYLALKGADNETLKEASDFIITHGYKYWQVEQRFGFKIPTRIDHIDLIEVAPGKASLKVYGGRLHSRKIQDLPLDFNARVIPAQRAEISAYCANDLQTTEDLYRKLLPQIELREQMGKEYQQDLRSKSDAQMAEAIISKRITDICGVKPSKVQVASGTVLKYKPPEFLNFHLKKFDDILKKLVASNFYINDGGKILMPDGLDKELIDFAGTQYRIGIGGLHSCEETVSHHEDNEYELSDVDVSGYYPAIIINCYLYPHHLGKDFLSVYHSIVRRRLIAKKEGNKPVSEGLKIAVNGSFGKFGSKYSCLYSPDLLLAVTLTGQLALFMLIESLEQHGGHVVSANTDGVVIKYHRKEREKILDVIAGWEMVTGFETEETHYKSLYMRDINNYIGIKTDGKHKVKGAYASAGLQKNPVNEISTEAVIEFLKTGKPIIHTIYDCHDIRRFVTVRAVKGGAVKDGVFLGKACRWYYAKGQEGVIQYKVNGYTVPRSEGAKPLMELPDEFPADIDYDWYVREAGSILKDIGATK